MMRHTEHSAICRLHSNEKEEEPRTNWFVNICNIPIPSEITGLLQLSENFYLPSLNREKATVEYIKSVEDNFCRLQIHNSSGFRNKLFPLIRDIKKVDGRTETDNNIVSAVSITKKFMANNPNIIFIKSDKGNAVIALNRSEYIAKIENIFSDTNIYTVLQSNPINKLIEELKKTLKRWI